MNYYKDTDHRYLHDADFRAAVQVMMRVAEDGGFTPGELKQIAFKAALELEMRRPPTPFRFNGVDFVPAPQATIGNDGKDGGQ
jgi:hypothetical protein